MFLTSHTPNGQTIEISCNFIKSQQAYRLSIVPYIKDNWLDPMQGRFYTLYKGRKSLKRLAKFEAVTAENRAQIANSFTLPESEAKEIVKGLYLFVSVKT